MRNLSITAKIVALTLLVSISSITILGIYYFRYTREAMLKRTIDQLTSVRVFKKSQVEQYFTEKLKNATSLSTTFHLLFDSSREPISSVELSQKMQKTGFHRYGFVNMYLVDSQSKTVFSADEEVDVKYSETTILNLSEEVTQERNLSENPIVNDVVLPGKNGVRPALFILSSLKNDLQQGRYTILFQIDADSISQLGIKYEIETGFGNSGEAYIVGSDSLLRTNSRFVENAILRVKANTIGVQKALSGITGTEVINDYRGIKVLSSFEPLRVSGLHWAVLSEIDFLEAMKPVNALKNDIIFLLLVISFFVLTISIIISRTISTPILNLKRATEKVGEGNFDVSVPITASDEIGSLGASFNQMASQIKSITQGLYEREERLNLFYNATTEGIIIHEKGKINLANSAALKLTNKTFEEITQIPVQDLIREVPKVGETLETTIDTKGNKTLDIEVAAFTTDFSGRNMEVLILRDISIRKQAARALENEQRKRTIAIIDGQELERKRISRELHDGLGQKLVATKLQLEAADEKNNQSVGETIESVKKQFAELIAEVRQISGNLRPPALGDLCINDALNNLCSEVTRTSGIQVKFSCLGEMVSINERTSVYLYRITQEALTNSVKHSKAQQVNVQLVVGNDRIMLMVEDDGVGFSPESTSRSSGFGIYNMRERAELLGGKCIIESEKGTGTTLRIVIPQKVEE